MRLGTSSVIVAAFVGPGTILTCASAGINFGYALGWVLVFATLAVFVLQSFTAGTGILSGKGLGEAVRELADTNLKKGWMYGIVMLGLGVGCAAFESGNLAGAAAGLQLIAGVEESSPWWVVAAVAVAAVLLSLNVKRIIQVLALCVAGMGILFLLSLFLSPVDWFAAVQGLFVPSFPQNSILTVIALIGTTIVTYTLFLHPGTCKMYWEGEAPEVAWRQELKGMALFIPLGGFVSMAIFLSGASLSETSDALPNVAAFAVLLEPVVGESARYLFGLGLFAAGLTSAVTAPLAAAIGISELIGWKASNASQGFIAIWAGILVSGLFFNLTGVSPLHLIIAAQAANGVLLPLVAGFILYLSYRQQAVSLPGWYKGLGIAIVGICSVLGIRTLYWVWSQLAG